MSRELFLSRVPNYAKEYFITLNLNPMLGFHMLGYENFVRTRLQSFFDYIRRYEISLPGTELCETDVFAHPTIVCYD
jgi:hypothetical protein